MAIAAITGAQVQTGTAWTGTAPGRGNPTISGTITSASDLSTYCQSVGVECEAATVDGTTFGDGAFVVPFASLKSNHLTLNLINDFALAALDSIIRGYGLGTVVYYDVKATSSARGTSNPSYVGAVLLTEYKPITVKVGDLAIIQVSWPNYGKFTELTA